MVAPSAPPDSSASIDDLVAATPDTRDRSVDFLRAVSIAVVVLWHWVFSVTHWNDQGTLTMPNPLGGVPGLWLATWVLQIMPLFFFVGGFANFVSYRATRRTGAGDRAFVAARLRRLFRPIGVFVLVWSAFELLARVVWPAYPGVLHWGFVVFVPLWFLAVYGIVVACVPLTARRHQRAPGATLAGLGALVALVDVARFAGGVEIVGYANVLFVFLFVHQLGYFYGDGTLTRWSRPALWAMTFGAFATLVTLTGLGPCAHSMVAMDSEAISNMLPPNACIAALGVFQAGLALLLRPALNRWLARRRPWKVVVGANAVAMTIFTWHMTAYVVAVGALALVGHGLGAHATAAWWLERPLWLLTPGAVLALFIRLFARFDLGKMGRGRRRDAPTAVVRASPRGAVR